MDAMIRITAPRAPNAVAEDAPHRHRGRGSLPAAALLFACLIAPALPALAQSAPPQLPGLVVSVPTGPTAPPTAPPLSAPPAPATAQPQPTPKTAAPKAQTPKAAAPRPPAAKPAARAAAATDGADGAGSGSGGRRLGIAVFVNDDIITDHEITQRARLLSMSANISDAARDSFKAIAQSERTNERLKAILQETIEANKGKTREQILAIFDQRRKAFAQGLQQQAVANARSSLLPKLRSQAREELIEERLKVQEAKRLSISIDEGRVEDAIKTIAQRNNMTPEQFGKHIGNMGGDLDSMKSRFRAGMLWADVIRRRFAPLINVNEADIDQFVTTGADAEDRVELKLHRIAIAAPKKLDQQAMARLFTEAETLRRNFRGCAGTAALAASVPEAKFEDLGVRTADKLAEPTRSILLNAKDGEMAPPAVTASGVELYAVCSRDVTKATEERRNRVAQEIQSREFDLRARGHLQSLRQQAQIRTR